MDKITNIELFAGAGGLALGLEQAGIEGVEFVEFNHAACETLRANRPNWNVIEGDVHTVDFTEYKGKVDLVSGGADYSLVIAPVVADLCTTPVALSAPPNSYQNNSQS